MIEKVEMYTVVCDNCGNGADEESDYSCWSCEETAKMSAQDAEYITHEGKDYCPECLSYGDDDEIIINQSRTKTK